MKRLERDVSILIILMGSVGDVVRGLALVDALRKALPKARIGWLVEPKCEILVKLHKEIDEVIVFDREKPISGLFQLYKKLNKLHFDITLDLQRHLKSGIFSWLSRAPRRIAFHRKNSKEGNWIFNNEEIPFFSNDLNKFYHYFKFLEYLGLPLTSRAEPRLSDWAQDVSKLSLPAKYNVGFVLASSWPSKNWPKAYYEELINKVLEVEDAGVVLLGDSSSLSTGKDLEKGANSKRLLNIAGKSTLEELLGIMRKLRVCIGPDSGPGHIAAALGTAYVALFGPTSISRTAPVGNRIEVLHMELPCSPCYKRECPGLGQICMTKLTPQMVFEKLLPYILSSEDCPEN